MSDVDTGCKDVDETLEEPVARSLIEMKTVIMKNGKSTVEKSEDSKDQQRKTASSQATPESSVPDLYEPNRKNNRNSENEIQCHSASMSKVSTTENLPHSSGNCNMASDLQENIHGMEETLTPANYDEKSINNNLLVFDNIPEDCEEDELLFHLEKFGSVSDVHLAEKCAIVMYSDEQDAQKAFASRHMFLDKRLQVYRVAKPCIKLYLGNLPDGITDYDILQAISEFGLVLHLKRPHRPDGQPQNFCFVKLEEPVASSLIEMKKVIIKNGEITVEISNDSKDQQPKTQASSQKCYCVSFTNLPLGVTYDDVREQVNKYGRVTKLFLKGRCGYVNFSTREAQEALLSNPFTVWGQVVTVMEGDTVIIPVLHIGGLHSRISDKILFKLLSQYGAIQEFVRPRRHCSETPSNYCFVKFAEKKVADSLLAAGWIKIKNNYATVNPKL